MEDEEEDHAPSEQEVTLKSKGRKRNTVDLGREILKAKPIVRSRFLEFDLFSADYPRTPTLTFNTGTLWQKSKLHELGIRRQQTLGGQGIRCQVPSLPTSNIIIE